MSKKLKLTDREWREFVFGELFDISSTSSSIDKKRLTGILGNNPYITRSENNNGIDSFIDKQACFSMDEANVITIGLDTQTVFYQSFPFYTGQNIQIIRHSQLNKHNALFVIRAIKILVQKFSWGSYGATLTRLKRGKLFLPVNVYQQPDWAFMGAYMRQIEDELLSEVRPKLEAQLLEHIISLGALEDREWREFVFGDLFDISSTGSSIDKKRLTGILGNNPYITRSENNNGIDSFIDKQACFSMDEANVITIGLDTQTVFYQSFPFYTGQNIQVVRHPQLNKYNALFVIRVIKILVQKFSWGSYGATLTRLRRGKLFLPVDTNHLPDWAFMEAYMKKVEQDTLSDALRYFKSNKCKQMLMGG